MQIELTEKEFRRLLDMVYVGNWVLNSTRGSDRFDDYDRLESKLFAQCARCGMDTLYETDGRTVLPSAAFAEGGIHEAIMDYEDAVFFDILAQELAARDMISAGLSPDTEHGELFARIEEYLEDFDRNGMDNIIFQK